MRKYHNFHDPFLLELVYRPLGVRTLLILRRWSLSLRFHHFDMSKQLSGSFFYWPKVSNRSMTCPNIGIRRLRAPAIRGFYDHSSDRFGSLTSSIAPSVVSFSIVGNRQSIVTMMQVWEGGCENIIIFMTPSYWNLYTAP